MKYALLLATLLLTLSFTSGCKKDCKKSEFQSSGQITGKDLRKCSCCGGYFITIDAQQYRFLTLPAGSDINPETDPMPIAVALNWHKIDSGEPCSNELITIEATRKR